MRIDPPEFENNIAYQVVTDRLRQAGFQAYAVGGCVRDAILHTPCSDVDVATNARPHDLTKVFGVRQWDGDSGKRLGEDGVVLYPTGVRHGTWTVRVDDDEVEVTTFRKDVATDGRNATVEFADTVQADALRRDFTMNALYYHRSVGVVDPTGEGVVDLLAGRVRFVGDADQRVKEDYLRILRLFRFHARFGRGPMDTDAWNAAILYRSGLKEHVSGERMWDETKKLLSAYDPFDACAEMGATMVSDLFYKWDVTALGDLLQKERKANCAPRWTRRYAALVGSVVPFPHSNSEQKSLDDLSKATADPQSTPATVSYLYGELTAFDWSVLKGHQVNHREITRGAEAVFPVTAQDLMDVGYKPGKAMGDMLRDLRDFWFSRDIRPTRAELLDKVVVP